MKITESILRQIAPTAPKNVSSFVDPLNEAILRFDISTPSRLAMFLAQVAHESGGFKYVRELADGSAYEGRDDLGNTQEGDGKKYKGRGLIQITGRNNYRAVGSALGVDFVSNPQLLEAPSYAALSAGWFWYSRELNKYADLPDYWRSPKKQYSPFQMVTYMINGGQNGAENRQQYLERAKKAFGI